MANLLEVKDLQTYFSTKHGLVKAVDGVSFSVAPGQTVCLVGESGSGKSMSAWSVMGLVKPRARSWAGRSFLRGKIF
ncbi:hypothetical protein ASB7_13370 [Helicobacter ailurogastricus]|nr:hypothetical protein ASB7_13370 [Helicobacter ailurogastricus]